MKQPALGSKIVELRKQKGLTQEELVERCNINVRTLQRIENGEVSPRSYTIKTILSALDHDYEELYSSTEETTGADIVVYSEDEAKSIGTLLIVSSIFGILYLLIGPFEGFADYYRFGDGELVFGLAGHIIIKIISYIGYAVLIYGFLIVGKLLRNYLMKIAAVLLIVVLLLFYAYDITSLFFESTFPIEGILIAESIILGTLGVLFGISILKSAKKLGTLGYVAGGLEIITAVCFLLVVLSLLGLVLQFPTVIVEVIVLLKIRQAIKVQSV